MPAQEQADETLVLSAADERSVVQTRFPTTTLYLARAAFGESMDRLAEVAAAADGVLAGPSPPTLRHTGMSSSSARAGRWAWPTKPR